MLPEGTFCFEEGHAASKKGVLMPVVGKVLPGCAFVSNCLIIKYALHLRLV